MSYKVPFIRPSFPSASEVSTDYKKILEANWYTNFGPFEEKFAAKLSFYMGKGFHAVTFSSATAALIATMLAVMGKGNNTKYVLMPSFTFPAGADAIIWCGYKPLFVDIETKGLHMDISSTRNLINDNSLKGKISGILFCNAFGVGTNNIDEWESLAEEYGLPLIIDSAAGFGSKYSQTRKLGTAGTAEIFSFHATKPFAIGEGGAVITRGRTLVDKLKAIQNFGFDKNKKVTILGFNGKLQEINAAIGLRQFNRFNEILENRQTVFENYKAKLDASKYAFQQNASLASLCFATVIVKDHTQRDMLVTRLKEVGVEAKTYYSPVLHGQGYFAKNTRDTDLSNTKQISESVISLPIHDYMAQQDIDLVINTLNS